MPFVDQISQFNQYARPALSPASTQDLAVVWIGINDIGDTAKFNFSGQTFSTFPALYRNIISIEFDAVETLYDAGYTNYLFLNLPPLERTVSYQDSWPETLAASKCVHFHSGFSILEIVLERYRCFRC